MNDVVLNVPAIVVAAIAAFLIGGAWFSPFLFGKTWMAAQGYTPETMALMRKRRHPAVPMAISFLCHLVTAVILAILIGLTGVGGLVGGLVVGIVAWLGFAATTGLLGNLFSDKPLSAFLVATGYHVSYLAVMGAIIGAWQ